MAAMASAAVGSSGCTKASSADMRGMCAAGAGASRAATGVATYPGDEVRIRYLARRHSPRHQCRIRIASQKITCVLIEEQFQRHVSGALVSIHERMISSDR